MLTRDFDFELPTASIAQEALARGESRLLVLENGRLPLHRAIRDLPELLKAGDLLVVNDTRVIPARLFGRRATGGRVELLLVERVSLLEWDALVKPARKAKPGTRLLLEDPLAAEPLKEEAEIPTVKILSGGEDGKHRLRFDSPIEPHLERLGHVPLPPYIKRPDTDRDRSRYQTVYARQDGAIAAPTAGLHFTEEILERLRSRGVERAPITLHVGIGTFKPVSAELMHEHRMDAERWEVPETTAEAIRRTREYGGRIIAVGTTVVRTLESSAIIGAGIIAGGSGSTELFIRPGFHFQVVDLLLTNFHLPRSTLLALVSALAGRERVLAAYREAIQEGYRFYSYGDAMLVERAV